MEVVWTQSFLDLLVGLGLLRHGGAEVVQNAFERELLHDVSSIRVLVPSHGTIIRCYSRRRVSWCGGLARSAGGSHHSAAKVSTARRRVLHEPLREVRTFGNAPCAWNSSRTSVRAAPRYPALAVLTDARDSCKKSISGWRSFVHTTLILRHKDTHNAQLRFHSGHGGTPNKDTPLPSTSLTVSTFRQLLKNPQHLTDQYDRKKYHMLRCAQATTYVREVRGATARCGKRCTLLGTWRLPPPERRVSWNS